MLASYCVVLCCVSCCSVLRICTCAVLRCVFMLCRVVLSCVSIFVCLRRIVWCFVVYRVALCCASVFAYLCCAVFRIHAVSSPCQERRDRNCFLTKTSESSVEFQRITVGALALQSTDLPSLQGGVLERDTWGCSLGLASSSADRAWFSPRHCAAMYRLFS